MSAETVLMIQENRMLIPLSTEAFKGGIGPRRKIRTAYLNASLLFRDGTVRRITSVDIDGLWGATIWRKLWSALTSAWRTTVHLSAPERPSLEEIKQMILPCVREDQQRPEPFLELPEALEVIESKVARCGSCAELFSILSVPRPEDALDVL